MLPFFRQEHPPSLHHIGLRQLRLIRGSFRIFCSRQSFRRGGEVGALPKLQVRSPHRSDELPECWRMYRRDRFSCGRERSCTLELHCRKSSQPGSRRVQPSSRNPTILFRKEIPGIVGCTCKATRGRDIPDLTLQCLPRPIGKPSIIDAPLSPEHSWKEWNVVRAVVAIAIVQQWNQPMNMSKL